MNLFCWEDEIVIKIWWKSTRRRIEHIENHPNAPERTANHPLNVISAVEQTANNPRCRPNAFSMPALIFNYNNLSKPLSDGHSALRMRWLGWGSGAALCVGLAQADTIIPFYDDPPIDAFHEWSRSDKAAETRQLTRSFLYHILLWLEFILKYKFQLIRF